LDVDPTFIYINIYYIYLDQKNKLINCQK